MMLLNPYLVSMLLFAPVLGTLVAAAVLRISLSISAIKSE
jgi:hypothetical protein